MSTDDPAGHGHPYEPAKDPYAGAPAGPPPPPAPQAGLPPWLARSAADGRVVLASFGERLLARLVDLAVLLVPVVVGAGMFADDTTGAAGIALAAVVLGYEFAMLLTQGQQTVGKKVMKLRVVSAATGGRPADGRLFVRSVVYAAPPCMSVLGAVFGMSDGLCQ